MHLGRKNEYNDLTDVDGSSVTVVVGTDWSVRSSVIFLSFGRSHLCPSGQDCQCSLGRLALVGVQTMFMDSKFSFFCEI